MAKDCRVVYAAHGQAKAMDKSYRVRIESRARFTWFGFKAPRTEYRAMIEENFTAWKDYQSSYWTRSKKKAIEWGNDWLDDISTGPSGEYI